MTSDLLLRNVVADDLPIFFEQQLDPDANYMAAFTPKDPANREAFTAHWHRILADPTIIIKTIVCEGQVVGHVLSYEESGKPEVSFWIGTGVRTSPRGRLQPFWRTEIRRVPFMPVWPKTISVHFGSWRNVGSRSLARPRGLPTHGARKSKN